MRYPTPCKVATPAPPADIPSGRFGANSARALRAAIAHNPLRAAGVLADAQHGTAHRATLQPPLVTIPALLTRPQRKPLLHLPSHGPREPPWLALWHNTIR
ncbi:transposase, IS4 family [Mycobacterium kansasii 732]|nr:transposase, IS4 family [Mycobacterium kansasii 732]KZS65408.1 hypothetical protein A4G27_27290 [Mycobacterium kansasii]